MISKPISRRAILRGGAVALSLPWLETLAPRLAKAAAVPVRRYLSMYFPNGSADKFWLPPTPGSGSAWSISPILEPLLPSKKYMMVLGNVGNYASFGGKLADPSHGTNCAGAWHCFDPRKSSAASAGGGISVDQVIVNQIGSLTRLPSLQVGLSTLDSSCDGTPCAHSRSISWSGPNMPLYKIVNPQAVFDRLVAAGAPASGMGGSSSMPDPNLVKSRALKKSVLDAVLDSSASLRLKLSMGDQVRVDQFMTSVRDLEKLVASPGMQVSGTSGPSVSCGGVMRPAQAYADMNVPPGYSRETHANLMIQLVAMAFACDLTRTVSFMLDDARSDYVYTHVPMRKFNMPATGMSSPGTGTCAGYHGLQHAGNTNDGFATITWWMASKANQMAQALASIQEGAGNAMDSTVIHFGSGMHGGNHDGLNLPIVLMGSGGGILKQDTFMNLNGDAPGGGARLANLHLTLMQKVFGCPVTTFGSDGNSTGIIPDILA
jgi:hypothetical protein